MKCLLTFSVACWLATFTARADINWRLSVKLIADDHGAVPAEWSRRFNAEFARANDILARHGRGYRLELTEVLVLTGISQWHLTPVDSASRDNLHATARAQPALYGYRTDAINIYIVANLCHITCDLGDAAGDIILMSGDSPNTSLLHLCGHFFNLRHTHEGQSFRNENGSECGLRDVCNCGRQLPGNGDATEETAPDNQCYPDADAISRAAFNISFVDLDPLRQLRVENSLFNVMSYHDQPVRLTTDQLDYLANDSNSRRRSVASGDMWFLATDGSDSNSGRAGNSRFRTVTKALTVATANDVVLLRSGTYTVPQFLNQPVTIRATRGAVDLIKP